MKKLSVLLLLCAVLNLMFTLETNRPVPGKCGVVNDHQE